MTPTSETFVVASAEPINKLKAQDMNSPASRPFETCHQLKKWLQANHATESELWVKVFKKDSGTKTVTWNDCVDAAIVWGWIDGQRLAFDDVSYLQRLTPRRRNSSWSKRNTERAERLIAQGYMQPPGLTAIEAARQDGRWERAYSGSADMVIPADFLKEMRKNPAAKRSFKVLDRKNLYGIYHRVQTAKRLETRTKRIEDVLARSMKRVE